MIIPRINFNKKDIVLFINAMRPATLSALKEYHRKTGVKLKPIIIVNRNILDSIQATNNQSDIYSQVHTVSVDFESPEMLREAIQPFEKRIFSVTSQYENCTYELKKVSPILPLLNLPSETSLDWATEKKYMRDLLSSFDSSLTPKYVQAASSMSETVKLVSEKLKFPVIVKPSGLEGSLFVSSSNNSKELKESLENLNQKLKLGYEKWVKRQKPTVVVEEFMNGEMYSIDTYIFSDGSVKHTPLVRVVTGKEIGFDDFFGYSRVTPVSLSQEEISYAQAAAESACKALRLKNLTVHVELMKTVNGWKIIEVGPRIGGYRHEMYMLSHGINHIMNDIIVRSGSKNITVNSKKNGFSCMLNIYAKFEGIMKNVSGLDFVEHLESFVSIKQLIFSGQDLKFAKNNGDPVFEILLFNKNKNNLNKDIESINKNLTIS